ncbi:ExbD/TolR family protein [Azohydromonas sediminis]|uniref:ExbD/TolR family protein n=1 Tax=Azohydromonas sediminis TaxID=2259674 RepID=UPI000E652B86|nr:biopolymer transporter ExbD [Azohydromonas sediminis]
MAIPPGPQRDDDEPMVDINTTPLIDVMLVLLIMLIITVPIQTHAVKMAMPVPAAQPPAEPRAPVRIDIEADGTLGWSGEVLAGRADLEARLARVAADPDPPEVHVRPSKDVAYEHVAAVLASAQRMGVAKIGIVGHEQFVDALR